MNELTYDRIKDNLEILGINVMSAFSSYLF